MTMFLIRSDQCAKGLHGFCRETRATCDCTDCHLGPCATCGKDNLQKLHDGLCADCKRDAIRKGPIPVTACDECGASGAVRNPRSRKNVYLCMDCHRKTGEAFMVPNAALGLIAVCKGTDVSDPRHSWFHVRGSRFACGSCQVTKFDDKARADMRREMLNG